MRRGRAQHASSTVRAMGPVGPPHACHGAAIGPVSRTAAWVAALALAAFARRHRHRRRRHQRPPRHPVAQMAASSLTSPALLHRKHVAPRMTAATRELVTSSPCANQGRRSAETRTIGSAPAGRSRHRRHHRRGSSVIRRLHRQRRHLQSRARSVPGSSSPASSSSAARWRRSYATSARAGSSQCARTHRPGRPLATSMGGIARRSGSRRLHRRYRPSLPRPRGFRTRNIPRHHRRHPRYLSFAPTRSSRASRRSAARTASLPA